MKCGNVGLKVQNFVSVSMATQTDFIYYASHDSGISQAIAFFAREKDTQKYRFFFSPDHSGPSCRLIAASSEGRSNARKLHMQFQVCHGIFFLFFLLSSWNFRRKASSRGSDRAVSACLYLTSKFFHTMTSWVSETVSSLPSFSRPSRFVPRR